MGVDDHDGSRVSRGLRGGDDPSMPRPVAAGHEVTGMARRESKQAIREPGAVPVVADALTNRLRTEGTDRGGRAVMVPSRETSVMAGDDAAAGFRQMQSPFLARGPATPAPVTRKPNAPRGGSTTGI
jgi:hypothetical protein